ncbi:MAG: GyrI-like domain-containing protein [Candidatus Micrarchaeia archaeon]
MKRISIVSLKAQKVLGARKKGAYQEIIPLMIRDLCDYAQKNGVGINGAPIFVCHEKTSQEAQLANANKSADVEVCIPIAAQAQESAEFKHYELPEGEFAKVVHKGPYEKCAVAYESLFAWVAKNKKTIYGPIREVYLNDPREVKPSQIITEIYAQIK